MRTVILALVGAWGLVLPSGARAWQADIVGTATRSADIARAVAVDAAGHVVSAGVTQNSGIPQDFTVLKVDGASGAELWRQIIHGTASSTQGSDGARAVAVDAAGDVIAAGAITDTDTGLNFTVIKFDGASGTELWRQVYGGGVANAVAVDAAGNVIAAGTITDTDTGLNFTVIKFDGASGAELWRAPGTDSVNAVAVDAAGNVIAATGRTFTVIKFDGASGAELWHQSIHGTSPDSVSAWAVAVDAAGDVVAAGAIANTDTRTDFTVVKFDGASGAERWRQAINGLDNGHEEARAVTVDAAGNVIAAGRLTNTNPGIDDFTVIKFDGASGAERWRRGIRGQSSISFASAVTVDAAGDVVAAGRLENGFSDFTVIKFDGGSGAERWRQMLKGTANSNDSANAVAVDAAGAVIAAGSLTNMGTGSDFTVVKFDGGSGAERWRQEINGSSPHINDANAVAVDAAGNVIAADRLTNTDTDSDFTVVKFDGASGAELWRQMLNGTANSFDIANAVAVDAAGDVVAAGQTDRGLNFLVLKFDGTSGAERWRQSIPGGGANAVAVDAAGDVIAAGDLVNMGTGSDFTVAKFDGASGAELWRRGVHGTASSTQESDVANAVAVDAVSNVIAAGFLVNMGTGSDFTVAKFDGASGAELWRQVISGAAHGDEYAKAVTVNAAGDVIAAGFLANMGTGSDFTVVKFDGASGAELWRQMLNGTANSFDMANAVTVNAAGDVIAAGFLANMGTGSDFTVVKFDGASGTERWRQVIPARSGCCVGGAQAVTVDATGNVVAAGWTANPDASPNFFTVVKFDGASGAERWRRVIPTPSGCCLSRVNAVAVDTAGDVVAAGSVQDNDGSHYTVVKLRGTDGGDFETSTCIGTGSFRLGGRVRTADRSELPDVTLILTGPAGCRNTTLTTSRGHYVFRTLGSGTYTLTPEKAGCTFRPPSRTVTLAQAALRAHFHATCPPEDEGEREHKAHTERD